MLIADEKEYTRFKELNYLDEQGTQDDLGHYWRTGFPWEIDPAELPDNKAAVLAVMLVTEKKLQKNPDWRCIYEL